MCGALRYCLNQCLLHFLEYRVETVMAAFLDEFEVTLKLPRPQSRDKSFTAFHFDRNKHIKMPYWKAGLEEWF